MSETATTTWFVRCPQCGHSVAGYFDHVGIECEHDMTTEQINRLISEATQEGTQP